MIQQRTLALPPLSKGFHLISEAVKKAAGPLPETGLLHLFLQHTSAALAVNENADPSVRHDLNLGFDRIIQIAEPFTHLDEGLDDMPAHLKAVLVGCSLTLPITQSEINLGMWQGIYLCEFRERASARKIILTLQA